MGRVWVCHDACLVLAQCIPTRGHEDGGGLPDESDVQLPGEGLGQWAGTNSSFTGTARCKKGQTETFWGSEVRGLPKPPWGT